MELCDLSVHRRCEAEATHQIRSKITHAKGRFLGGTACIVWSGALGRSFLLTSAEEISWCCLVCSAEKFSEPGTALAACLCRVSQLKHQGIEKHMQDWTRSKMLHEEVVTLPRSLFPGGKNICCSALPEAEHQWKGEIWRQLRAAMPGQTKPTFS